MDNILDVCQMSMHKGQFQLNNISFSVKKGYITGLVGRNGSGKTTLLRSIFNAEAIESGTIQVFGRDSKEEVLNKQELGIVMDDFSYFKKNFSIWENARMVAPLYRDWDDDILYYYLKKLGIITGSESNFEKYGDAKQPLSAYSRGEQAKIRLAFALTHKPRLLLLDEPSAYLDPIFRREFLGELQELLNCPYWLRDADEEEREEKAMGIILCTHITSELDRIADYILLMDKGCIIADGERDELFAKHGVSNTKELVLKLTGDGQGYIFHNQELSENSDSQKQPKREKAHSQNGKRNKIFDSHEIPANVEGLRQCEDVIYKRATAGRIFSGCLVGLYLLLVSMDILFYVLHGNQSEILFSIACVLIAIINMTYYDHHTEHWEDELKELMPYLPFCMADMKVCLKAQTKRLLIFWLVVQGILAVLAGGIGVFMVGKPYIDWMTGLVLGGIIITLCSALCELWRLNNQKKYLYIGLFVVCLVLVLVEIFL